MDEGEESGYISLEQVPIPVSDRPLLNRFVRQEKADLDRFACVTCRPQQNIGPRKHVLAMALAGGVSLACGSTCCGQCSIPPLKEYLTPRIAGQRQTVFHGANGKRTCEGLPLLEAGRSFTQIFAG